MIPKIKLFLNKHAFLLCLLLGVAIYFSLAFKNPFAVNSLIPNLEPYPDTLYYATTAWNFTHGEGFKMSVFGVEIAKIVPPAYSLFLIPFFAVFKDVRSFYIGNLILGFSSIITLWFIANKIFKRKLVLTFLLLFLLTTNFYFFNLPGLLMAENITVLITLFAVWILISAVNTKTTIYAGFTGLILLLIKFSNLPLGVSLLLLYTIRVVTEIKKISSIVKHFGILSVFIIVFIIYLNASSILNGQSNSDPNIGFSVKYFIQNLNYYLGSLFGGKTIYLWYQELFLERFLTVLALAGFVVGLLDKNIRKFVLSLGTIIVSLALFMSFFYYPDSRYILAILPLTLLLLGTLLYEISLRFSKRSFLLFTSLIILGYLFSTQYIYKKEIRLITFKKQIGLNFLHKEDPWNYLAIQNFNDYFKNKKENVYLGTFLPPFYMNYFMNGNYKYLPISPNQEFTHGLKDYFGNLDSNSLIEKYHQLITSNNELYISDYYINNNSSLWNQDLDRLKSNFDLEKKADGCYGSCNIYRLKLKTK